ncbi:hypothetical protein RugamoR57_56420 [Duganella caerulea]|uniref:hypothetical protein n=1 Tax=Duganella caerulea TaxID=2885762 RepID=UPI0030E8548B
MSNNLIENLSECLNCLHRRCENSTPNTLDICDYGIAYFNNGEHIQKKREGVTLRHVAQNLRHELHKVLQLIISEACDIDDQVSVRTVDLDRPASRIVGATVILDNFIEMIAGVYNFDPYDEKTPLASSAICLYDVLTRYKDTYSLIRNTRRTTALRFRIDEDLKTVFISNQKHVIEYIFAILIDNVWKYSLNNTPVVISATKSNANLIDISVSNFSEFISQDEKLFDRGYQVNTASEGFGFGLYWATLLVDHYNRALKRSENLLILEHTQKKTFNDLRQMQVFSIKNISIN